MSKQIVITHLEGIEEIAPLLDKLPVRYYDLHNATSDDFHQVVESFLKSMTGKDDMAFVVVMSKKTFIKEENEKAVGKLLTGAGIKAETVFLVADKNFKVSELKRIIQCNHLFYSIPDNADTLLNRKNTSVFRGYIDKALLDYRNHRKLIELISDEFLSFIEKEQLRSTKEEVEQLNMELESQNKVDELTKLLNRKGIVEYFQIAKGRAARERWRIKIDESSHSSDGKKHRLAASDLEEYFGQLACMMIDIDDFKKVNDTHGHLVGDKVLKELGEMFTADKIFRDEDISGRYGGEEFIVILPATNAKNARVPAEKLRKALKAKTFQNGNGAEFRVTISIGVAELESSEESIEEMINKADMALYRAKETGKDKTILYSPAVDSVKS
jgi:diguanylate cyclase (GGDEF)-like protein